MKEFLFAFRRGGTYGEGGMDKEEPDPKSGVPAMGGLNRCEARVGNAERDPKGGFRGDLVIRFLSSPPN